MNDVIVACCDRCIFGRGGIREGLKTGKRERHFTSLTQSPHYELFFFSFSFWVSNNLWILNEVFSLRPRFERLSCLLRKKRITHQRKCNKSKRKQEKR